jgi:RNA polymerase sigma factor (sigma-70 family)
MSAPDEFPDETIHLLRRFQRGEAEAGEEVFARYYDRVRRILRVRAMSTGSWCGEFEDLLQETFLAALSGLHQFEPRDRGGFVHWLTTIAEHKFRDALRRQHALRRDVGREVPMGELTEPDPSHSTHWEPTRDSTQLPDVLERGEAVLAVDRCLAALRPDYREAILLRFFADSPWSFVAEKLGCPSTDAAMQLGMRARSALAAAIAREGYTP